MPAFSVAGGECHWQIAFCFYVVLGKKYALNEGCFRQGADGNPEPIPEEFFEISREQIRRLHRTFHRFFNKDLRFRQDYSVRRGEFTRYEFAPCCTFEVDIELRPITPQLVQHTGNKAALEAALPENCGVIILERMSIADHAHAEVGGNVVVMDPSTSLRHTFPHELGHILGMPDKYSHPAVPELGVDAVDIPQDVEDAYAGRLMGREKNNKREITAADAQEIADTVTALTCDADVCCPNEAENSESETPDEHPPGTTRPRMMKPWNWHFGFGAIEIWKETPTKQRKT